MDHVTVTVDAAVATVLIDRPPINALSSLVQDELATAAREVTDRADVRAVVVHGGPRGSGRCRHQGDGQAWTYTDMVDRSGGLQSAITDVVAASPSRWSPRSPATRWAAGCELALAADFRVAATTRRFGQPEILLGIIPGAGGTQRLPRLVGPARAKDLIFTGRIVEADEALRDRPGRPGRGAGRRLPARPWTWRGACQRPGATRCAPPRRPSTAASDVDLATGLEIERVQFAALFATEDREIGMQSFIENGPGQATFTGA